MPEPVRILGLTLARGGSRNVPRKNIRPILGVPLIAYTIAEARRSRYLTRYIVSTDDPEIRDVALRYGAEVPFLRPPELAADTTSSVAAMQHAVRWVETEEGRPYDFVIELMCTNPMKTVVDIDAAIGKLIATGADAVIGVVPVEGYHPARIKKIVDDRLVDFCVPEVPEARRQDLKPEAYLRNGSIYALRRDLLMVEGLRYGTPDCRPYIMPADRSINVDSRVDFAVAEVLLAQDPRPYVQPVGSTT